MTHSEWLADYREQHITLRCQNDSLNEGLFDNITEALRRNDNQPIKIGIIWHGMYELTTIRLTDDWSIVFDSVEEVVFNYNELDRTTLLNVYEQCIKELNLE